MDGKVIDFEEYKILHSKNKEEELDKMLDKLKEGLNTLVKDDIKNT